MENEKTRFHCLDFLSMLYVTLLIFSVLVDYKFIAFGNMLSSCATLTISSTFFLIDVIAEVYGYQRSKQIIMSGVVCLILFSVMGYFLERLHTPEKYFSYGTAYHTILTSLLRAGFANAVALILGSFLNVYFITKWKALVKGKYFFLRSLGSSIMGEGLYTVCVTFLVNAGVVSQKNFFDILTISYSFKLIFDFFAVFPTVILASFLKNRESQNSQFSKNSVAES